MKNIQTLTYDLDRKQGYLYETLYQKIKNDILSETLKANEKLPSKRSLAEHLKISVITVETAYAQLLAEGYIYSIEKSGYYVNAIEQTKPTVKTQKQNKREEKNISYFMDFKANSISEENFPYATLSRLMRTVMSEQQNILKPLQYNGTKELRDAIAAHLYRFRGMIVDSEQIVIGAGTEYLYNLIIQLLGRDKIYAVENPGYQKIAKIYELNNVKCRYISIDAQGFSVKELMKAEADVIHISPTHHFPSGKVMPIKRRYELLRWANERNARYIIEDDYDSEFRFSGKPIPTLLSIDQSDKVIYMNTFSKSIAPAMRISYMILPEGLARKYHQTMSFYSCTVSGFDQYMLAKFISEGHFEKHINRMKTLYRAKRDAVISAFQKSNLFPKMTITEENAGLHFLLRIETDIPDAVLAERAEKERIRLSFLSEYTHEKTMQNEHMLIVNYSGIDINKLPEAISRMERIFLS